MALLQVSGPIGERFNVPANNDGPLDVILVDPTTLPAGAVAPFRAEYYVDPAFAGIQTGSSANPFTTIAAAFAAALAFAQTSAIIFIPAGVTVVENVVFPATGIDWEISCKQPYLAGIGNAATISGTVTCNTTSAFIAIRITNVAVTGAVTGNAVAGTSFFFARHARISGAITLTTAGATNWLARFEGLGTPDSNGLSGRTSLAVNVAGTVVAINWYFAGPTITDAPATAANPRSIYRGCLFELPAFTLGGGVLAGAGIDFHECQFNHAATFTAANPRSLAFGPLSYASLLSLGATLAGPITTQAQVADASALQVVNGNVAPTGIVGSGGLSLPGVYEAVATLDLDVAGTAGTAVVNAIYTDLQGVVQTKPILVGLLITAAVGTEAAGSVVFRHNGATTLAYSVTGIVTPGALSARLSVAMMRKD